ncbi:MAG TPA: hypothetical protein VFF06_29880 [Polyangia bacterium]|nr:hypothetical protein [Polyangia bacterium]
MVRYRIHHPDDAPSSPTRRSALISLAADARDEVGDVSLEGDQSVIELARKIVADYPEGLISTFWLTRISPEKLQWGMSSPVFRPFHPELVSGAEVFARRAPPALQGEAQAQSFTWQLATDLHAHLPLLEASNAEKRAWYLSRLEYDLWGFQHWRPGLPSSESAAAAIAHGLAERIASERKRLARGGDPARNQPGFVPLIKDTVTEQEALALARAFVDAFEAASLDDPAALAADLRRRVQALKLV